MIIDAGPFDQGQDGILVPGAYDPSPYFWPIVSVPQEALNDTVFLATSARVVGGGSTINAMIFARGDVEDYQSWAKLGNEGWAWDDLLPYFIKVCDLWGVSRMRPAYADCGKSENFTPPDLNFAAVANISWDNSVHGFAGPVQNTYPNYFFPGSGMVVSFVCLLKWT